MHPQVSQYINKQSSPQKEILLKVRDLILKIAPTAEECMSYGVPAFKLNNKTIMYATFKSHVGLYPDPSTIEYFHKELASYPTSKGTIKFEIDKPIPYDLITKIVKYKLC